MAGGDLIYRDISTGGSFIHRETSQVSRSHAGEKSNQVNFFFFFVLLLLCQGNGLRATALQKVKRRTDVKYKIQHDQS